MIDFVEFGLKACFALYLCTLCIYERCLFHAKVTAIEECKDLDDIKVQELISSLQTYELLLPTQRKSKSLALKTSNERVEAHDSSDEDVVEKDVAYLAKNF